MKKTKKKENRLEKELRHSQRVKYRTIEAMESKGLELCPYIRNPKHYKALIQGECAVGKFCTDGLQDYTKCRLYKEALK